MAEAEKPGDLKALGARIDAARGAAGETDGKAGKPSMSGSGFALRAGIELVACLGVGVGIGLWLDRWLGTEPWLLALFFVLGSAAGVMTVLRLAGRLEAPGWDGGNTKSD